VALFSTVNDHAFLYSNGTMIDLGTLPGGGSFAGSIADGINDSGQVVGQSATFGTNDHGFLYSGGTMVDLGTLPGGYNSFARGINSSSQIVGNSDVHGGVQDHAFLYSAGRMIDLGTLPGGTNSGAWRINNSGQVVGQSDRTGGATHAFLYSNGRMTDLGTLSGASDSFATSINNSGQIVGYSDFANGSTHAFLYGGGTMSDLGTLPGGTYSSAGDINSSGQIVGAAKTAGGVLHAVLYSGGTMTDLNNLVSLGGAYLTSATRINDHGQIVAIGSDGTYLLAPATVPQSNSFLLALNPFAPYAVSRQAPPVLNMPQSLLTVLSAPPATSLAADGEAAVVLAYQSSSRLAVTFTLSPSGTGTPIGSLGSLGPFDPNYLGSPSPPTGIVATYQALMPYGPDAAGNYVFLALLWAPSAFPTSSSSIASLGVTAVQSGNGGARQLSIALEPPPLILVHGIWSSAADTWLTGSDGSEGFFDWISSQYPHNLIFAADYGTLSAKSFADPAILAIMSAKIDDAVAHAAEVGMVTRRVDVVAHSMGGLVTRYLISTPSLLSPALPPDAVHELITIGTPHLGSALATTLFDNQSTTTNYYVGNAISGAYCINPLNPCTLGGVMASMGKQVSTGVESLEPGSPELLHLQQSATFRAIVGNAPTSPISATQAALDTLINAFLPGQTVGSILNHEPSDTIVPASSQSPSGSEVIDSATVNGIVHTRVAGSDIAETRSPQVWSQAYYWLTGGEGAVATPVASNIRATRLTDATDATSPVLNLIGYTQIPATNASFLPVTGSSLTINSPATIAASSTKTIIEVLLLQDVTDPTDTPLLYSTQSPFAIPFTPTRLGSTSFIAIVMFSDNTFAMTTLSYTFQPGDTPYALNLVNAPVAIMKVGDTRLIEADAVSPSGPTNATQLATYTARSGSQNVFSVGTGGMVTAAGNGVDLLDVAYGGVTTTVEIPVGACTYSLNPTNQIVSNLGGTVLIQVITQSGCSWTASGGADWVTLAQASGNGSTAITLTAAANNAGGTQGAVVTLAGVQAFLTQPDAACTYGLSTTQIHVPAAGTSGTIIATTACPVTVSVDQSWVVATTLGTSVQYTVAPNNGALQRSATLTVGTVSVPVVQSPPPCYLRQTGSIDVVDVQSIINEALGAASAANDLNGDGLINVADVQIEINAALSLGCITN
jgi:probable HAF family extracellular repeat protein